MGEIKIENLKRNQEKQSAKILIILFYGVFGLYELFLKLAGFHQTIVPVEDYPLFRLLQNILYGFLLFILPLQLMYLRKDPYKVKYISFGLYVLAYTVFEIMVYRLIEMEYATATILDMIFILISPIFVSRLYFKVVFGLIIGKILMITIITGNLMVFLGMIIIVFLGIIAYIILVRFTSYLNYTHHLYEAERELELYKSIAYKDELTGVYTKRFINLELEELNRRQEKEIGFVMVDLDNFKMINDQFNHVIGDQVLIKVVDLVQGELEYEDFIGRYGGDEFILLLKDKTEKEMKLQLSKIQSKLDSSQIIIKLDDKTHSFHVTASIGFYYMDGHIDAFDALREADNRLITAKQEGKNHIIY
jgi:diguanylate cyclase (GGDEF)-like protein